MKAYVLDQPKSIDDLRLVDQPQPEPNAGEVVVKVSAVSLNYRDLMIATNGYGPPQTRPLTPCSDGAGEVVAVGAGVTRVKAGDHVAGIFMPNWIAGAITAERSAGALGGGDGAPGMLAEYVALPAESVVPVPPGYSDEEAAALPCAAVTAWHALIVAGKLAAGDTVLLLGTGGVSIFGLQIAHAAGARTIITSSSDEKLERARGLGADETINYKSTPAWERRVWELTGGAGATHVLEVGGVGTLEKSVQSTGMNGGVYVIGGVSGFGGDVPLPLVLRRNITVRGIYVGSRDMFVAMNRSLTQSKIRPVIDKVFPFDDAASAYRALQSGSHFGKVVIRL